MVNVLVTGGAGFIGSNFVRYAHRRASRLARHHARQADLRRPPREPARRSKGTRGTRSSMATSPTPRSRRRSSRPADYVVHFAAETHVDRSIREAGEFIKTDVIGTFVLLEAARAGAEPEAVRPDLDRRGLRLGARGLERRDRRAAGRATPTRRARPAPTASPTASGPPTACRSSSPAPRTTTGPTSSPRRSSRSSSPT